MKLQFVIFFSLVVLCGCTHFDYVGRSFDQLSDAKGVRYFEDISDVNAETYLSMGNGTLRVPADYDDFDVEDILLEEARKNGADAVVVLRKYQVKSNWTESRLVKHRPAKTSAVLNSEFGPEVPIRGEKLFYGKIENVIECRFLKDRKTMQNYLTKRNKMVDELAEEPAGTLTIFPDISPLPANKPNATNNTNNNQNVPSIVKE